VAEWTALQKLIDRCDEAAVAAAVRDLDPGQRRELAEPLRGYERELRADIGAWLSRQPALAVAGAAVLPGTSALAPWLARNRLSRYLSQPRHHVTVTGMVVDVLRARQVPWLGDLARRLAERLPSGRIDADLWELTSELVTLTGIDPPTTDGFVIGWAQRHWGDHSTVAGAIRRDRRLAALIPRLLEIERVSASFARPISRWPSTLALLAANGLVDRVVLLDSCLAALQRGGRLAAVQGRLRVHEALAATVGEVTSRTADYVALLPDSHSVVATMAQRELCRLHEAGQLAAGTLCQASRLVLTRTEKTLIRAQLRVLDAAAGRDPAHAPEMAQVMATVFGQHAADVQQQALTLVVKHLSRLDKAARAEVAAAARALPADLRATAAAAFGDAPAGALSDRPSAALGDAPASTLAGLSAAGALPAPQLPPPTPRELPLIGSPEELAAEIASLHASLSLRTGLPSRLDPVNLERVLAGVVAISPANRIALAAALERFLARNHPYYIPGHAARLPDGPWPPVWDDEWFAIIRAVVIPAWHPPDGHPQVGQAPGQTSWRALLRGAGLQGPQAGLMLRLNEIATGLSYAPRPLLLATPTTVSGLIDPAELVARLRRTAANGCEPWPVDLEQALLRLPRAPDPAAAAQARTIGTPAALTAAQRLSAGSPPDPEVASERRTFSARFAMKGEDRYSVGSGVVIRDRVLAVVRSRSPGQPGDPCTLAGELDTPETWHEYLYRTRWMSCWPMMLPAHRDVAAAHLVPHLSFWAGQARSGMPLLPMLAAAEGPVGDGMNLALAYGLGASDRADRAAAVDALITLAARRQLDGAAVGRHVGTLAARGALLLNRVVPGLRDAANAGAPDQVWALVAAALPSVLPPAVEPPLHRLAELVELGAHLAETCRPAASLPSLQPLAAQRGSSQLVTQARRLQQALSRSSGAT